MYFIPIFAAMKKERIQIDLTSGVLKDLQTKAAKTKRTRKAYIEFLCEEHVSDMLPPENKYKCPAALWRKFSNFEKHFYNTFMEDCEDQLLITVLKNGNPVYKFTDAEWRILTHNSACCAIWALPKK